MNLSNSRSPLGVLALLSAFSLSGLATAANAQTGPAPANAGAALPLPPGVNRLVSIDAFNDILAQSTGDNGPIYNLLEIQHVYSGGIARLFGGTTIPTAQFVSPGGAAGNAASGLGGAGFGGAGFGVSGLFGGGATGSSTATPQAFGTNSNGAPGIGVIGAGLMTPRPGS